MSRLCWRNMHGSSLCTVSWTPCMPAGKRPYPRGTWTRPGPSGPGRRMKPSSPLPARTLPQIPSRQGPTCGWPPCTCPGHRNRPAAPWVAPLPQTAPRHRGAAHLPLGEHPGGLGPLPERPPLVGAAGAWRGRRAERGAAGLDSALTPPRKTPRTRPGVYQTGTGGHA